MNKINEVIEQKFVQIWNNGTMKKSETKNLCDWLCKLPISNHKAKALDELCMLLSISRINEIENYFKK